MNADEPLFLTRHQIQRLHDAGLARFGGSAGIRDEGLIESALASAKNAFYYGRGDGFDVAAAYAFHLAESQAFTAGNKRVGAGAALTFLELNGVRDVPCDDALYDAMMAIANKQLSKSGFAALPREHARQRR
jgi:death-on-curing protein